MYYFYFTVSVLGQGHEKLVRFWTLGEKKMLADILAFRSECLSSYSNIALSGTLFFI